MKHFDGIPFTQFNRAMFELSSFLNTLSVSFFVCFLFHDPLAVCFTKRISYSFIINLCHSVSKSRRGVQVNGLEMLSVNNFLSPEK